MLPGKRHISGRPAEVETRETLGHWEGDTVIGSDRFNCVLTLVERKTAYTIIRKMPSRTAKSVVIVALQAIAQHRRKFTTLTLDNGTEFHGYEELERQFPITCSFATPYHSWERGCNENLNGLFRRYVPKGSSMKTLTQADCDSIANQLNSRPRKRLGFKTPNEAYFKHDSLLHLLVETTTEEVLSILAQAGEAIPQRLRTAAIRYRCEERNQYRDGA